MTEPLRRIGLTMRAFYLPALVEMARQLKQAHGSEIHLYCTSDADGAHFRRNAEEGLFASVTVFNVVHETQPVADDDAQNVIDRARELERETGVTINRLAVANRHLGKGFALGGPHHPKSVVSEDSTYVEMVATFVRALEFWRDEVRTKQLTMFINGPPEASIIARAYGLPYRSMTHSRHENLYLWGIDEFLSAPQIEAAFDPDSGAAAVDAVEPYKAHQDVRNIVLSKVGVVSAARDAGFLVARRIYWKIRGYKRPTIYYLSSELRLIYLRWVQMRVMTSKLVVRLSDIADSEFVYYPLHTEPEKALQGLSPEYFFQLETIAAVARDLPAGVKLAVKETPAACGRRPIDFYEQISALKNVVFIDMRERGVDVIAAASAVVTISGSSGVEAALMGKPVIAFGRHNIYNFLPDVFVADSPMDLSEPLAWALSDDFDNRRARSNGARFLEALRAVSFDMGAFDHMNRQSRPEPEAIGGAIDKLIESVPLTERRDEGARSAPMVADSAAQ